MKYRNEIMLDELEDYAFFSAQKKAKNFWNFCQFSLAHEILVSWYQQMEKGAAAFQVVRLWEKW